MSKCNLTFKKNIAVSVFHYPINNCHTQGLQTWRVNFYEFIHRPDKWFLRFPSLRNELCGSNVMLKKLDLIKDWYFNFSLNFLPQNMHIMQTIVCISILYFYSMIANCMTIIRMIIKTRNKHFFTILVTSVVIFVKLSEIVKF